MGRKLSKALRAFAVSVLIAGLCTLAAIVARADGADWLVGHRTTYADFRVACVLPFADLAGLPLADFPRVEAWHARLMDIPAWRDPFSGLDAPELPPIRTGAG